MPLPIHSTAAAEIGHPAGKRLAAAPQDRAQYEQATPNPVMRTAEQPVSTFSLDVDTASYANTRRYLRRGQQPPRDAVRTEEFVNYFPYDYQAPDDVKKPFRVTATVLPTPWNKDTRLLHLGIRAYDQVAKQRPRLNLVFLIDVSGSMLPDDRLPLLKQAIKMLVDNLTDEDSVGIVTYSGASGVALEPTHGRDRAKISAAIEALKAGGSTAGQAGIETAYALAQANFDKDAVNRIVLGTDGDFNVGASSPRQLEELISEKRRSGVYLSVIGVGDNNYNDRLMQVLAQKGNGTASYIDSMTEARKVMVEQGHALFPVANDAKVQVEFNPEHVAEYRLVGYETRLLRREDFKNDAVDAGDISSGHTVTALYEIVAPGGAGLLNEPLRYRPGEGKTKNAKRTGGNPELAHVRLRYKLPGVGTSELVEFPVHQSNVRLRLADAPTEARFAAAVAGFAQLLSGSDYVRGWSYGDALALAEGARGEDPWGYRAEFLQLVRLLASPRQP